VKPKTLAKLLSRWQGALNNEDELGAEEAENEVLEFLSAQEAEVDDDEATNEDEAAEAPKPVAQRSFPWLPDKAHDERVQPRGDGRERVHAPVKPARIGGRRNR